MSVATVREKMATALRTITDLKASEYITESINPPMAMFDYRVNPDLTFARGADVYTFTVRVFAARTPERASQVFLDLIRDPSTAGGVKRTLEDNADLAAVVDYVHVTEISEVEPVTVGNADYLSVRFTAEVVI